MAYHINKDGTRNRIFSNLYYTTGLDDKLRLNLDDEKTRVIKGEASIIIVDGGIGSGKTNTAITMARYVQEGFNHEKQVGRGIEQFSKAWEETLKTDAPVRVCVFDEANTFNKKGSMSKLNKNMDMFFNTFRHNHVMLIVVLPHFSNLDASIYDTQAVRGLVHMWKKYKTFADIKSYNGISVENMLDYIDKNKSGRKRFAKRRCYNTVSYSDGHVKLPKDSTVIDTASNLGKTALLNKSIKQAVEQVV